MDKIKIDILKNEIDVDSIITSLYSSSTYTDLFLKLLRNPSSNILSKLVINYFSKMITDIKYLIKFKYKKLNSVIQDNLNTIVILLLDYNANIDTLIINLLRHGIIKIPLDHYYFKENQSSLGFIMYHKSDRSDLNNLNYIASTISFDMESDIHFINEVRGNIKFYVKTFINKYKRNSDDILRFIKVSKFKSKNIDFLIKNFNKAVKNNLIDEININKPPLEIIKEESTRSSDLIKKEVNIKQESPIKKEESPIKKQDFYNIKEINIKEVNIKQESPIKKQDFYNTKEFNIKQEPPIKKQDFHNIKEINPDSILLSIGEFHFSRYFKIIQNMKFTKNLFIDPKFYKEIIIRSFDYDNYVQVYLWKILVYQKILFDIEIEIDENELITDESKEGYDIYLNIH